ncbi:uncharacterized protein LOC124465372 isoform X2 [Hypomesus transpacificus]|uniref:uncharacterized protein LOC124465372 isoform X2 n=1 Tax=Hypomesus transpacificus TaxID=137520 RepID=UPI001F0883EB|nr:uncharacterized protein LOC124465372 isoform X2 [Hypomesus transpacificus]
MLYIIPLLLILRFTTSSDAVIKAMQGHPVYIPCPSSFAFKDYVKFQWRTNGTLFCVYEVQDNITTKGFCPSRFDILRHPGKFYITDPKVSDSGQYNCSITRVIPPPFSDEFHIVDLQVEDLVLTMHNQNSSCILLLCTLEGLHTQDVNFTWFRQGQGSLEPLSVNHSSKLRSSVLLCQAEWREGDRFICKVNISINSGLNKSITLPHSDIGTQKNNTIIITVSILGGLVAIAAICICVYKWEIIHLPVTATAQESDHGACSGNASHSSLGDYQQIFEYSVQGLPEFREEHPGVWRAVLVVILEIK